MKEILHILLILFFSLTIISCAKKADSSSSSSGSSTSTDGTTIPIELSDVNANLSGKSLFVTNESIESNSSRTMNRSSEKSSTSTNSLIVIDNNSVPDYGVLSNYELAIDQVRVDPDNKFAYIILEHDSGNSTKNDNLYSLNCGIIRVDLSNDAIDCLENGIVPIKRDNEYWYGENYALSSIQFASSSLFYLTSYGDDNYKTRNELKCEKYCLYKINNSIVEKITTSNWETQAFYVFKSGSVAYYELNSETTPSVESGIKYRDSEGNLFDITTKGGFFSGGDYNSIIKDNDNSSDTAISRVINNQLRRTYLKSNDAPKYFIKSNDGYIYAHGSNNLYSLLPFNNTALVSLPSNRPCDYGFTCSNYFKIHNKIAVYSVYTSTTKKEVYLYATDLGTDNTTTILKPNSDCSNNCYNLDKWYQNNNEIYVSLKNLNTNKYENILIDTLTIDFNKDNNQFEFMENIDDFMNNKKIVSVSSTNSINQNSTSPTAEVKHIDNDTTSMRIEFNNIMNYSDVESKVSIVDNSSNNNIWFMPVWNNKTLHLVIDTDNGTVFDNNADPLTSGTTYKVTILGTSKDSDGNTLGSDVVKYITP